MASARKSGSLDCGLSFSPSGDCALCSCYGIPSEELTGLEWNRVGLERQTAWLNRTKNGTPRGVPLN